MILFSRLHKKSFDMVLFSFLIRISRTSIFYGAAFEAFVHVFSELHKMFSYRYYFIKAELEVLLHVSVFGPA